MGKMPEIAKSNLLEALEGFSEEMYMMRFPGVSVRVDAIIELITYGDLADEIEIQIEDRTLAAKLDR